MSQVRARRCSVIEWSNENKANFRRETYVGGLGMVPWRIVSISSSALATKEANCSGFPTAAAYARRFSHLEVSWGTLVGVSESFFKTPCVCKLRERSKR